MGLLHAPSLCFRQTIIGAMFRIKADRHMIYRRYILIFLILVPHKMWFNFDVRLRLYEVRSTIKMNDNIFKNQVMFNI